MVDMGTGSFEEALLELAALKGRLLECHELEVSTLREEIERLRKLCVEPPPDSNDSADKRTCSTHETLPKSITERTDDTLGKGREEASLWSLASAKTADETLVEPTVVRKHSDGDRSSMSSSCSPRTFMQHMPQLHRRPEWILDPVQESKLTRHTHSSSLNGHWQQGLQLSKADTIIEVNPQGAKPKFMLHPQSNLGFIWDLANMLLTFYDIILTPLEVFVSDSRLVPPMDWLCVIFWTTDILFTFQRAIYKGTDIEWNRQPVARQYLRTWFLFDFGVIFPDWVSTAQGSSAPDALAFLRVVRILRLLRLLRLMKLEWMMHRLQARVKSTLCAHSFGIMRLVLFIIVLTHFLACIWYFIGVSSADGWAVGTRSEFDLTYGYFTSLHWSITQFHASMEVHPGSLRERVFAVVVVLVALIVFSQFLSSLTDMMIQLQRLRYDKNRQHEILHTFLIEHDISAPLSVMVKNAVEVKVDVVKKQAQEQEVLQALPHSLLVDLCNEARAPLVAGHDFFSQFQHAYPRAVRMMCFEAITQRALPSGEIIFSAGDPCSSMFFVEHGALIYTLDNGASPKKQRSASKQSPRRWKLSDGEWICEIALWGVWSNVGELAALWGSFILEIDATRFAQVLRNFEKAHLVTARYALEFVEAVNHCKSATDIDVDMESRFEDDKTSSKTLSEEAFRARSKDSMGSKIRGNVMEALQLTSGKRSVVDDSEGCQI